MERTLAELRKAKVCLTLAVQRLGQFGGVGSGLRRGVVDTVGTLITMNPGIEEIPELAKLLSVERGKIQGLGRGQAVISGLTPKWSRAGSEFFEFEALTPPEAKDDPSLGIRATSYRRYYQSPEAADNVFRARAKEIQNTLVRGKPGDKDKAGGPPVKSALTSMLED
jgi:hypothetical protein